MGNCPCPVEAGLVRQSIRRYICGVLREESATLKSTTPSRELVTKELQAAEDVHATLVISLAQKINGLIMQCLLLPLAILKNTKTLIPPSLGSV